MHRPTQIMTVYCTMVSQMKTLNIFYFLYEGESNENLKYIFFYFYMRVSQMKTLNISFIFIRGRVKRKP